MPDSILNHDVVEYNNLVAKLLAKYPLEEAMSLAVGGGNREEIGDLHLAVLQHAGLCPGASLLDFGCGSGRTAVALSRTVPLSFYVGIDVVETLLDYAEKISPPEFRFIRSTRRTIPMPSNSFDMVCAFSVFTHLMPEETYLYMEDILRVLKLGGKLVFSFLEVRDHWHVFAATVDQERRREKDVPNVFLERGMIDTMAEKLGYVVEQYVGGMDAVFTGRAFGHSIAILRKP
jgi:ubiquinone/menaquinone biosynthesis C-methylase UbiE